MSAMEAASAGVRDLADGSLRITIEFSPLVAKQAYALFGARGTPLAVVALKEGFAQAKEPEAPKEKVGPLCLLACQWCADERFQEWVRKTTKTVFAVTGNDGRLTTARGEEESKRFICQQCEVDSRKQLDHPEAAEKFHRLIRKPYTAYLEKT